MGKLGCYIKALRLGWHPVPNRPFFMRISTVGDQAVFELNPDDVLVPNAKIEYRCWWEDKAFWTKVLPRYCPQVAFISRVHKYSRFTIPLNTPERQTHG